MRASLAEVKVPSVYLRPIQDRLAPARCLREILGIEPETKVVSIPGPHLLLQSEPQKTAEAVARFLRQLDQ